MAYLLVPVLWKEIFSQMSQMKENVMMLKQSSKICDSACGINCTDMQLYTANLFMGVAGNYVTVNNKSRATCNNSKQLPCLFVIKLIQILL